MKNLYFHSASIRVCIIDMSEHASTKRIFFLGSFAMDTVNSDTKQYCGNLVVISIRLVFTIVRPSTATSWNHTYLIINNNNNNFISYEIHVLLRCHRVIMNDTI